MTLDEGLDVGLVRVPEGYEPDRIENALERLTARLGWGGTARGGFDAVLPRGAKVVVKPNWVMHANQGPWGMDPLITHHQVIRAVVSSLLRSHAGTVTIGDAPLQSADFDAILAWGDLGTWLRHQAARDPRLAGPVDFRRTRSRVVAGVLIQDEDQRSLEDFVLFDLREQSLLEPVSGRNPAFRVTQYDPRKMRETHRPGRHRYLIARAMLEADVVVNLPKLKTHRKAGVTNALKNLVGINGNKEFLPHHRVGGEAEGGDCYPRKSRVKRAHELFLDLQNASRSHLGRVAWSFPARSMSVLGRLLVDELGVEGSWSGNDTVWRMCLDLNRILRYGRLDGTMAEFPQRRILHVVDGVIAGQGDGPLAPEPFELGVLLGGDCAAAVDVVGAQLLGTLPERIPIVREAFRPMRWPLAPGTAANVRVIGPERFPDDSWWRPPEVYPAGWLDSVTPQPNGNAPVARTFNPRTRYSASQESEA